MIPDGFTSLGWQMQLAVSLPVFLVGLLLVVVAVVAISRAFVPELFVAVFLVGCIAALTGGIFLFGILVPFNPAYWDDYRVEGRITSVSNTWTEDGGNMARTPVVTLDTIDRPLVIDDPRTVQLEGRDVSLTCTIDWHYRGADAYTCRIANIKR